MELLLPVLEQTAMGELHSAGRCYIVPNKGLEKGKVRGQIGNSRDFVVREGGKKFDQKATHQIFLAEVK
jgi:hypothetical protein